MRRAVGQGGPSGLRSSCGRGDRASQGGPGGQVVKVVRVATLDDMFSENIWFSCPKSSNNWEKLRCHACDILTKSGKKGSILFENNPQKPPCPWLLCYSV